MQITDFRPVLERTGAIADEALKNPKDYAAYTDALNGYLRKEIDGEIKTHRLIRADLFPTEDQAVEAARSKAKQLIKEQGERMFS